MSLSTETILQRIDELIQDINNSFGENKLDVSLIDKATFGALGLIKTIYAQNEAFSSEIIKAREKYLRHHREQFEANQLITCIQGILDTMRFEIQNGFITTIKNQTAGEIFGDFVSLAKTLISEGHKDSAAVLACGALEDSVKKYAIKNELYVYDEDLSSVINSLKSKGLLKGVQSGVVQSYVKLRNKAFHAQFDKIEMPEVASLISFVEQFLIENFE